MEEKISESEPSTPAARMHVLHYVRFMITKCNAGVLHYVYLEFIQSVELHEYSYSLMGDPAVATAVRILSARGQTPLRVEISDRSSHQNQLIKCMPLQML